MSINHPVLYMCNKSLQGSPQLCFLYPFCFQYDVSIVVYLSKFFLGEVIISRHNNVDWQAPICLLVHIGDIQLHSSGVLFFSQSICSEVQEDFLNACFIFSCFNFVATSINLRAILNIIFHLHSSADQTCKGQGGQPDQNNICCKRCCLQQAYK